jgi:hypothetical protein
MYKTCFLILVVVPSLFKGQNALITSGQTAHDYGAVENVYKLQSDFILKNESARKLFLLRADAGKGVKVLPSKKTVMPGDTFMVQVYYYPESEGKFNENVNLVTSADAKPYLLQIKGEVKSLKQDDKTACYYFKRPSHSNPPATVISINPDEPKPGGFPKRKPIWTGSDSIGIGDDVKKPDTSSPAPASPVKLPTLLDPSKYKPNNVIFLIDVSSSMGQKKKLDLMKISMDKLLSNIREEDKISLIIYSDTVICLAESFSGLQKENLRQIVRGLKSYGNTKGNKAIQFSLEMTLKNYIEQGNNMIIMATDGQFPFRDRDYVKWTQTVGEKNVVLSVVALGEQPKALANLKEISKKGKGSFIHITTEKKAESAVFDEIEKRSRK